MSNTKQEDNKDLQKCVDFLNTIGIPTLYRKISNSSFLPGLLIENGGIVIDKEALLYPGDILHEAGHIATMPAGKRQAMDPQSIIDSKNRAADEMMAIAWSYAACIHLELDPYFVFHAHGYKEGSRYIVDNSEQNTYLGLFMLQGVGMTADEKKAKHLKISPYPNMIKWLRDE